MALRFYCMISNDRDLLFISNSSCSISGSGGGGLGGGGGGT